jgi:hypothetical protein
MDHLSLSRVQSAGEFLAAADAGGGGAAAAHAARAAPVLPR